MKTLWLPVLLLLSLPIAAIADEAAADRYLEDALSAAGDNRAELERVLAHFAGHPRRLAAARFLIENMPGKGYVVTELRTKNGDVVPYDPLAFETLELATQAIEALEEKHGELDFARDGLVEDAKTIKADFLIRHIDGAFEVWEAQPEAERVSFDAFLRYVLPYRGSQEPIDDWLTPLRVRAEAIRAELGDDASFADVYKALRKASKLRFNDRYYLHPTDQGYSEMCESGYGRCEDITNMATFAARSMAVALAADYTPAWAHRDNNHAWPVHLDKDGRGSSKGQAHAAKVYRKTYEIQRDALTFQLPEGQQAPNRFLQSTAYIDVTDQYAPTTDVTVRVDPQIAAGAGFAYLCVFNGGRWVAIHWARVEGGVATFTDMGRNICYLPAIFEEERPVAVASPLIVHRNGTIQHLAGNGGGADLLAVSTGPKKKSPDTGAVTPASLLKPGATYILKKWTEQAAWVDVKSVVAGDDAPRFDALPLDGLYWLVEPESRRLERIFTVEDGRQRWW